MVPFQGMDSASRIFCCPFSDSCLVEWPKIIESVFSELFKSSDGPSEFAKEDRVLGSSKRH